MGQRQQIEQQELEKILNKAVDLTDNKITYVTNIRFSISNNEATLDLFYVAKNPKNPDDELVAQRLHRVVMPLGLAKNIGQLLVNAMIGWEETFGISLPIFPDEGVVESSGGEIDDNK